MNQISLIGNLTRDPEADNTANGKSVSKLRVAIPRRDRDADPVYVDVVAYDGLADQCNTYLDSGRQVAVSGRLEYREWKAEDDTKRSKHEVIASDVTFLARPRRSEDQDPDQTTDQPVGAATT